MAAAHSGEPVQLLEQHWADHYLRALLTKGPKSAQPHVATQVRTIFDQADDAAVHIQFHRLVAALVLQPKIVIR